MKWLLFIWLMVVAAPALAQDRLALVIGNDDYASVVDLQKAVADAEAVTSKLENLGFETFKGVNLDRRGMNQRISEFTSRLEAGDTAFIFFAGHGVEIDGENYLLPTDIATPTAGESDFIKSESIALSNLLDRVRATGARTSIAIIDACRDNPFKTTHGRSIGGTRGLGRINAPQGMFVIFSAGAGQMALDRLSDDDAAQNSVFTRALLPRLSEPGLELRSMVAGLRTEVRDLSQTVQHNQVPAYYDELLGEFYFTPAKLDTDDVQIDAAPAPGIRADLSLARSVGTVAAFDTFLEKYADQSEDYSYKVALQLREDLASASPAIQTDEAPARASDILIVDDDIEVMRATQSALNRLGCSAGGADGIAGPNTRRAFATYLSESGSELGADDLGTRHALAELEAKTGRVCTIVASAPARTTAKTSVSLAGSWQYKATCALVVKVTGSVNYTRSGGNKYTGQLSDSLGQNANTVVYLNDQQLSGTDYFPGITVKWRGRLAEDGNSFTSSGSTGCSVYAWRVG
ncbi:MAG: caspase domain-containing protein [Ruegeria sp.]